MNQHLDYVRPFNESDVLPPEVAVEEEIRPPSRVRISKGKPKTGKKLLGWCFTYWKVKELTALPNPEKIIQLLIDLNAVKYCFQLERGEKSGTDHYQGVVVFKHPVAESEIRARATNLLREVGEKLYSKGCMHITAAHSIQDSDVYCSKDNTRIAGPWYWPPTAYFGGDLLDTLPNAYPWQSSMMNIVLTDHADPRAVYVIVDRVGKTGKSTLAKTLGYKHNACVIPLGLSSAQMKAAISRLGPRNIYIVDLPRNNKSYDMFFDLVEEIKRGFVISCFQGKYNALYMSRPHCVCFANEIPPLDHLSIDMFNLFEIDEEMRLVPIDKYAEKRRQRVEKAAWEIKKAVF